MDDRVVQTLRDTGCSGKLVKQELVKPDQYTEKFGLKYQRGYNDPWLCVQVSAI